FDTSMPFGSWPSLSGTIFQPSCGCHSQSSPVLPPGRGAAGVPSGLRREMLVTTTPPSGTGLTEFMFTVAAGTAQPIQVPDGGVGCVSTSNTSTDSRRPWGTTYKV